MRGLPAIAAVLALAIPAQAEEFPVPREPNQVFYVQRSINSNTVVYAARLDGAGALDARRPVNVYWRRYNEEGQRQELSSLESRFAFGVRARPAKDQPGAFKVAVVSYPDREVVLKLVNGVARLEGRVAGQPARLDHAYLDVDDSGSVPKVRRVDLFGTALAGGAPLKESFTP